MICKTLAIPLRIFPFSNTSRIAVWLSPDFGRFATLAKGAMRPDSPHLGQFDLFATSEVLFYHKEGRLLHTLKECALLAPRAAFRTDFRACALASYAASLFDRLLPFGPADPALYDLYESALDGFADRSPGPAALPRFELDLLRLLGHAPAFSHCSLCASPVSAAPGALPAAFDPRAARLLCPACLRALPPDAADPPLPLSPPALAILRALRAGRPPPPAIPLAAYRQIRDLLGTLLLRQLSLSPAPRNAALSLLSP